MSIDRVFSFLYQDPRYIDFYKYYERIKTTINTVTIEIEVEERLNKRVRLRELTTGEDIDYALLKDTIIVNSSESQRLRSRLCHLRIEVFSKLKTLRERTETLKKYLFISYKTDLDSFGLKTQADKNYILDSCFIDVTQFICELETLEQSLVFFIEDLDKNSWTMKNLTDLLELTFRAKI
jgi:hypothetical protein